MKKKKLATIIGMVGCMVLSAIACCGLQSKTVSAAETDQSVGDRYFSATSGSVESFLNKSATNQSLYKGIRTEVTDLTVGEDVTIYYNGLVSPTASNAAVVYYDAYNPGTLDAEAILFTYTLASDRSKQFTLISLQRDNQTYLSMALTDDIEIRDGYAYIAGTNQKTVALADKNSTTYTEEGFSTGGAGGENKLTPAGEMWITKTNSIGNILSDEFLKVASKHLAGTQYASYYTKEYVQALLTAFGTGAGSNTSIFSLEYKGIRQSQLAFHIRGISGQWIGDNGGVHPWNGGNTYGFATQKKTTIYLNADNNLADLFDLHTIFLASGATETNPFGVGFYGTDASGNGGTWFKIENGQSTFSYRPTQFGKFYVKLGGYISPNYSALGSYSPTTIFEFDVIEGYPEINGKENVTAIEGLTYNMSAFFDIWCLGNAERATFAYEVDGAPYNGETLLADGEDHEIKLTVTDEYGNSGFGVQNVRGVSIEMPESVTHTTVQGLSVVLPVPYVPAGVSYSVAIKDASGQVISNESVYVFEKEGTYTVEYLFTAEGADVFIKTLEFKISFQTAIPQISIAGEYEKEYYVGHTVALLDATAKDELGNMYTPTVTVYLNDKVVDSTNGSIVCQKAGIYTVSYVCAYANGQQIIKEKVFRVISDTEKPNIVVKGNYAANYEIGAIIQIFDFVAVDNSGLLSNTSVQVYMNNQTIAWEGNELVLSENGVYKIVYQATDLAGNKREVQYQIRVGTGSNQAVSGGCGSVVVAPISAVVLLLGACLLLCKKES